MISGRTIITLVSGTWLSVRARVQIQVSYQVATAVVPLDRLRTASNNTTVWSLVNDVIVSDVDHLEITWW